MEQNSSSVPEKILFLITIMNRDKGEDVAAFYRENGLTFNLISPGYGAAGLEILDYLGLTETEKDIVISISTEEKVHKVLPLVNNAFNLNDPGTGIAFTIPIAGISGPKALRYVSGFLERSKDVQ